MATTVTDDQRKSAANLSGFDLDFRSQLRMMGNAFWTSPVRNRLILLSIALLTVILLTAYGQIRLNEWNAPFYNALERRDLDAFLHQLEVFAIIAGLLLLLNVIQTWLNQMTALNMREGLAKDMVDQWLKPGRAARLAGFGTIAINPDQRLHDDVRNLAESSTALSIGLVNATILLISFIGVLWTLSAGFSITINGDPVAIPGYMVWAAILYAGSASLLSNLVGYRLVGLNAERYSKEAELRFSLMRASENLAAIALARGEKNERRRIGVDIDAVLGVIRGLALAMTHLTWVSSGYGWLAVVAPILIAAPVYFSGNLTFGGLMMAVGAFNQVNTALRWYIDNFGPIASWKATLQRVSVFRNALIQMDSVEQHGLAIDLQRSADNEKIRLRSVTICRDAGGQDLERGFRLREAEVEIGRGDRLMINGEQGVNRRLLFAAMAGLWPWGQGSIEMPEQSDTLFIAQHGYLPTGTLREILAYPRAPQRFVEADYVAALTACGLGEMAPRLDEHIRWDKKLDSDEQASIRIANALLLKPKFIVIDDLLEGLEKQTQDTLAEVLNGIDGVAIIYIGRSETFLSVLTPALAHLDHAPMKENTVKPDVAPK
ncbi:ABC transporter ATP-binding protein/permease [Rhizobium rhizogenes]|uniref:ABC transporter ATP-binding protein/permease n=1 Tax=Rhizobium rhizogenes TaxID=359 RepID=A0AA94VDS3_RHIRH|nr:MULTISPECIES: ABC transporter ATP-binding protein/permease [Rhizobium/Agrobacterium group]ADY66958.1 ABC transporter, nucleotide binding/ATPase protein [Agrobacterium tumefaciens]TRA89327.1 ABC transporter ATP-binding protein/permease [Rhizobium rhizogenes]CVI22336.1 ABC transporter, nucleotide binding/ATPase protein [Agrobacterium fabacearum CFBP 5771]